MNKKVLRQRERTSKSQPKDLETAEDKRTTYEQIHFLIFK